MTPLCMLERTPQKHQVISADDSTANELFDQVTVGRWELLQWHLRRLVIFVYVCGFESVQTSAVQ